MGTQQAGDRVAFLFCRRPRRQYISPTMLTRKRCAAAAGAVASGAMFSSAQLYLTAALVGDNTDGDDENEAEGTLSDSKDTRTGCEDSWPKRRWLTALQGESGTGQECRDVSLQDTFRTCR